MLIFRGRLWACAGLLAATLLTASSCDTPSVKVLYPRTGSYLLHGARASFVGEASDPQQGELDGPWVTWTSSVDGPLGTGRDVNVDTLSPGTHTITLKATDVDGHFAETTLTIAVQNQESQARLALPEWGSTFTSADSIHFQAAPRAGASSSPELTWHSSRDGVLGTGSDLYLSTLTPGTHYVTLKENGQPGDTVRIVVTNSRPVVAITQIAPLPPDPWNLWVNNAGIMRLEGTASDAEDGVLPAVNVQWWYRRNSAYQFTVIGYGPLVLWDTNSLTVGTYEVQMTAVDSDGAKSYVTQWAVLD
ncbi:MAG: PKD domain-containing protein [Planctomycetes bacterium]|nr:PKD domain-containing protein [Planctomycetota bacterium]